MSESGRTGRPLRFGISVVPLAQAHGSIVEQVTAADRAGLDLIGIQDHPYQRRFLDTYALIADLLARTSGVRIFPNVTSLPMRPPAMIAKAAASLDVMSEGRFELGLGSGTFWDAVAGMGGAVRGPGERLRSLEEAVGLIRQALDIGSERGVVRGEGSLYPEHRYPAGPPPAHRVEIWIGAISGGAMRLIGRAADGWIPAGGMSRAGEFPALIEQIEASAAEAGRDASQIRRIVNISGHIGEASSTEGEQRFAPGSDSALVGPLAAWIDTLTGWATDLGLDSFVLWPTGEDPLHQIELFANEVAPSVRAALA